MPATDGEYAAARERAAVVDRPDRRRWTVTGRDPAAMLDGILTNTIPDPLEDVGSGLLRGRAPYGLTLTPKGRITSDHRLMRLGGGEENAFMLDIPAAGAEPLSGHFGRYLPPRMAKVDDVSGETAMLTVIGPDAATRLANAMPGWGGSAPLLDELAIEGQLVAAAIGGRDGEGARLLRVIRSAELGSPEFGAPPVYDVVGTVGAVRQIRDRLLAEGCPVLDPETVETLRVEGGAPAFGTDMDESTIPVEAGVHDRAIDYEKGCYTGQEVIVRIRDRGHVNRHLRGLRFEGDGVPDKGDVLYSPERERQMGEVTSVARSPRSGGMVGLGYVRKEVEPGGMVRVGGAEGDPVRVLALDPASWPPGPA